MCGTLWAQYVGFVDPFYVFSVDLSVRFALNAIIGGMGTALGPFLGSILITSLETYLRATLSGVKSGFTGIYLIVYGVVLILVVRFIPEGLAGLAGRLRARWPGTTRDATPAPALLTLERVTKRFGGLTAVREVSLTGARPATCSGSSAPTAPARPRSST